MMSRPRDLVLRRRGMESGMPTTGAGILVMAMSELLPFKPSLQSSG